MTTSTAPVYSSVERIDSVIARFQADGTFGFAASQLLETTKDGVVIAAVQSELKDVPHDHPQVVAAFGASAVAASAQRDAAAAALSAEQGAHAATLALMAPLRESITSLEVQLEAAITANNSSQAELAAAQLEIETLIRSAEMTVELAAMASPAP